MASYKEAGVDVHAGYKAVELMKTHVAKTMRPEVLSGIGGFGGLFSLESIQMKSPILVSGTDGVGTKLKIAFLLDRHDTVGIDCVAMCANDVVCSGAQPLFFLDYVAVGKLLPKKVEQIVKGVSEGCIQAGCALIGGETAEMPGFYPVDEYDLAGFVVGIVDKEKIIDGSNMKAGDVLIGLASSGIHSNGYSLVRKVFNVDSDNLVRFNESLGSSVGEELLKPTKIYVKSILSLINQYSIKGIAHITGGGFIENIPRMVPNHLHAIINKGSWPVLPIFQLLQDLGEVKENEMYNTFNMGVGMVLAVKKEDAEGCIKALEALGEHAYAIGQIVEGEGGIELC